MTTPFGPNISRHFLHVTNDGHRRRMRPVAITLSISAKSKSSLAISSKKCGIANSYSPFRTFARMISIVAGAYLLRFILEQRLPEHTRISLVHVGLRRKRNHLYQG